MSANKIEPSERTDRERLEEAEETLQRVRDEFTEQIQQHADALLVAEERLNAAQRIIKSGSWERNLDTGEVWWSDELYRMHGEEPGAFEPIFDNFLARVHPDDRARVETEVRTAWQTTEPYESEFRILLADGTQRSLTSSLEIRCDAEGRPLWVNGTARDVTESKALEQALRESRARAQALLDANPDLIFRISRDGYYLDVHASDETRLAIPVEQLIGHHIREFFDADFVAQQELHIENALESGDVQLWQYQLPIQADSRNLEARFMRSGPDEVIAIVQDITEQTRLEREVVSIGENERRRIGHDLHDGLGQEATAVSLGLQALALKLDREQSPHAHAAKTLTAATQNMIAEIRRFARQLSPVFSRDFGLDDALRVLADEVKEYSDADCKANCRLPAGDALDPDVAVHLYRIAQESISNAVRHSGARNIELECGAGEGFIYLEVLDDGVGIPTRDQRAEGIGLRSMRYRARMLRGRLVVERRPHSGTRVLCSCPIPPA
jgi:signal transduction histidine kinase